MREEEFKEVLYGETIDLSKEEKDFKKKEEREDVLLEFKTAPYEGLMDKIRNEISIDEVGDKGTMLYMKYRDTGDTWELGYINMGLDFWKMVESVFINYKPKFYRVEEDGLVELNKIMYISTVKLKGSELDEFVE